MSTEVIAGPLGWIQNSALRGLILKKGLTVLGIAAGLTLALTLLALGALAAGAAQSVSALPPTFVPNSQGASAGQELGVFLLIWSFFFFTAHLAPFTFGLSFVGSSVFGVGSLLITGIVVVAAYRAGSQIERLFPYSLSNGQSALRAACIAIPYWIGCFLLFLVGSIHSQGAQPYAYVSAAVGPSALGLLTPLVLVGGAGAIGARRHRARALSDTARYAVRGAVLALFSISLGIVVGLIGAILSGLTALATHAASSSPSPTPSTGPTPTISPTAAGPIVAVLVLLVAVFYIPNGLFYLWGSTLGLHLSSVTWLILPFAVVGALLGALTVQPRADRTEQTCFAITFGVASFVVAFISSPSIGTIAPGGNPLIVLAVGLVLGTGLAIVGPYAARTGLGQSALTLPLMAGLLRRLPLPGEGVSATGPTPGEMRGVPGWVSDPGTPGPAWDSRPSGPVPASGFPSPGTSTAVVAPSRPSTAVQPVRLHFGKKARIATGAAVVLIAALVGLNIYLSSLTTVQAAAKAYEQALASNDASAIWSHLSVSQPTTYGVTANQPSALRLLSESDLKAMLSLPQDSHQSRSNISVGTVTQSGDSAIAQVSFQQQGQTQSETLTLVRDPSQHQYIFYPVWKIALTPGLLTIAMPAQNSRFAIDGTQLPAGATMAYVLPGTHKVTLLASGPFAATDVTTTVQSQTTSQATFSKLEPTPAAHASAAAAVKGYFTSCLQRTDAFVGGCPQQLREFVTTPVTWQLVGDPTSGLTLTAQPGCQTVFADGHYLMTASYTAASGPAHRVSGGPYAVPLSWNGQGFETQSQGLGCGDRNQSPALANPGANQPSLLAVVQAGWQVCLKATVLDPPDCPASAFTLAFQPSNIRWSSTTDPNAGAQVSWDGNTGVYKVSGNYSLVAGYSVFGTTQTNPVSGSYTAYVTWDGQTAKLVNIGPGNQ